MASKTKEKRPRYDCKEKLKRCNVTLPDDVSDYFRVIGNGNLSEGIRRALLIIEGNKQK